MIGNLKDLLSNRREAWEPAIEFLWLFLPSRQKELIEALSDCLAFVQGSEDRGLCELDVSDAERMLERTIARLKAGKLINKFKLKMQFQPTSDLQDMSIYNGWGDEFCKVADRVDRYL